MSTQWTEEALTEEVRRIFNDYYDSRMGVENVMTMVEGVTTMPQWCVELARHYAEILSDDFEYHLKQHPDFMKKTLGEIEALLIYANRNTSLRIGIKETG